MYEGLINGYILPIGCFMYTANPGSSSVKMIVSQLYLSLKVEGQAGDAVCVHIFEDGHSLHSVGVPHTDIRLLAHLSCGHQHTLRMQS